MARDKMDKGASFMEKKSFLRSGEGSIASYTWTDLITQQGYVDFYGMSVFVDDAEEFVLPTKVMKTQSLKMSGSCNYLDDSAEIDTLETSAFTQPLILGTEAYLTFSWVMHRKYAGGSDHKIKVTILKNDTSIGSFTGETISLTDAETKQDRYTIKIDLSEDTRVKIGDQIKIKFEITFENGDDDVYIDVYTDPYDEEHTQTNTYHSGSDTVTISDSQMLAKISFKVEL